MPTTATLVSISPDGTHPNPIPLGNRGTVGVNSGGFGDGDGTFTWQCEAVRTNWMINPRGGYFASSAVTGLAFRDTRFTADGTYEIRNDIAHPIAIGSAPTFTWTNTNTPGRGHTVAGDPTSSPPLDAVEWVDGQFTVSAWVYIEHPGAATNHNVRFHAGYYPASGNRISEEFSADIAVDTYTWTRVSATLTAPATTGKLALSLGMAATADTRTIGDSIQCTGFMVERTATLDDYFDGFSTVDAPNQVTWEGPENNSISHIFSKAWFRQEWTSTSTTGVNGASINPSDSFTFPVTPGKSCGYSARFKSTGSAIVRAAPVFLDASDMPITVPLPAAVSLTDGMDHHIGGQWEVPSSAVTLQASFTHESNITAGEYTDMGDFKFIGDICDTSLPVAPEAPPHGDDTAWYVVPGDQVEFTYNEFGGISVTIAAHAKANMNITCQATLPLGLNVTQQRVHPGDGWRVFRFMFYSPTVALSTFTLTAPLPFYVNSDIIISKQDGVLMMKTPSGGMYPLADINMKT